MGSDLLYPKFQAIDSSGNPLSGGKVYTYAAGTSTPKTTYSDRSLTTPNANPVILDSDGEANIYLDGAYKIVLKDSSDVTLWTEDDVSGYGASGLLNDSAEGVTVDSGGSVTVKLGDAAGVQKLSITDVNDAEVSAIDSNGNASFDGTLAVTGATTLSSTLGLPNGTTINEFSTDTTLADSSDDAVPTENAVKTYISQFMNDGLLPHVGIRVDYASSSTLTVQPGRAYYDDGSTKYVELSSSFVFTCGSGGSNSSSTDLGANQVHYIYLDDSAIGSETTLTAAMLLNSTTAPTFNGSKRGWYNGNDRCIGIAITDGSNNILEFTSELSDSVFEVAYTNAYDLKALSDGNATSFTDVDLCPAGTKWVPEEADTAILAFFSYTTLSSDREIFIRKDGTSGNGKLVGMVRYDSSYLNLMVDTIPLVSGVFEYKVDNSQVYLTVYVNGWRMDLAKA